MAPTPPTPKDAATVIVLRDAGAMQVFLVKRHSKTGFMAGAYVFPGGKLDDADFDPRLGDRSTRDAATCANALGEQDEARSLALFFAAIRETFEECGVLLASGDLNDETRTGLQEGRVLFADAAAEAGLSFELAIVPQARWITPVVEKRRYDTRFFLAQVPPDQIAAHDQRETTAGEWMTPIEALTRQDRGEILLPPPTQRTLEWLRDQGTIEAAFANAPSPPPVVQPVAQQDEGTLILALPGDPLHPESTPAFEGSTRFVLEGGRWWSR
ncbi:MAG: NUDIX hydrolase [Myxococcota bacterium]